jgi:hypothetical protein
VGVTAGLIGWFVLVELVSGILQGYYVPLFSDIVVKLGIHDSDVNWFEAAQLRSRLSSSRSSRARRHVRAQEDPADRRDPDGGATWWLAFATSFWSFLVAWALQGFYVVWLPLEIALIFERGRRQAAGCRRRDARRAARRRAPGGRHHRRPRRGSHLRRDGENLTTTLMVPAIAVTLIALVIWIGVPESTPEPGRSLDVGLRDPRVGALLVTGGLAWMRMIGEMALGAARGRGSSRWSWPGSACSSGSCATSCVRRTGDRHPRTERPEMWPVQATAFLVGISLLARRVPSRPTPAPIALLGYGLGLDATSAPISSGSTSSLIVGAVVFAITSRRLSPRIVLIVAAALVGVGYALFLPFHLELWQVL